MVKNNADLKAEVIMKQPHGLKTKCFSFIFFRLTEIIHGSLYLLHMKKSSGCSHTNLKTVIILLMNIPSI